MEDVLSVAVDADENWVWVTGKDYVRLCRKYRPQEGPGTELKKLLGMIGIKSKPTCSCNRRAEMMNHFGAAWCRKNIETIVDWLQEEATKRGLLFLRSPAKMLVKRAITTAERNNA